MSLTSQASTSDHASMLESYRPAPDRPDELRGPDGSLSPLWADLIEGLEGLGPAEMRHRHDEMRQLLEQDGVTYNVTDDAERPHRPWRLDAVPLVVSARDWTTVERGVAQRAELANLVLADLFGERRLLTDGIIPAALILSDPQFFRACDQIPVDAAERRGRQLVTMGVDLSRSSDGGWVVLSHRAEAPSGAWYALENRRVMSRVFPQIFRRHHVLRLMPFVRALRAALQSAAPAGVADPSIVVLSPGTLSETAFEHASIAAQLGYPLVEGSDLLVRDGRVWLRTVSNASVPVDVILRRLDTSFCDPLELRSNSTLGVPGLVDAARTGAVSIVNPLGSGLVESAGLAPLWSGLCRHLLGEDLVLPSVPAWWCGDDAGRSHVLANLDQLVLRPLSRESWGHSVDTATATKAELEALVRRIEAEPDQWVGQERVTPASTPVFAANQASGPGTAGLVSRPALIRTYAVAQANDYLVMDGGLARAAPSEDTAAQDTSSTRDLERLTQFVITTGAGAIAKDIWVLGDKPETETDYWLDSGDHAPPLTQVVSARAAENLFWLGRYAERTEAAVRLQRTVNSRRDEFESAEVGPGPAALVVLLGALSLVTGTHPGFVGQDCEERLEHPEAELRSLITDKFRVGTIAHSAAQMFNAIEVVRDQMSVDTWLVAGSLQTELDGVNPRSSEETVNTLLDDLLHGLLSLAGLSAESMVRDAGWHFMNLGRRLERALKLTALLRATLGTERGIAAESVILESVLTASESIIYYRRRYRSRARVSTALDMLLSDVTNPRSLAFQLSAISEHLAVVEQERPVDQLVSASSLVDEVSAIAGSLDSVALARPDDTGARVQLDLMLDSVSSRLMQASDAVAGAYFTRQLPQHQYSAVGFTSETGLFPEGNVSEGAA